jgi:hypothetical protein
MANLVLNHQMVIESNHDQDRLGYKFDGQNLVLVAITNFIFIFVTILQLKGLWFFSHESNYTCRWAFYESSHFFHPLLGMGFVARLLLVINA